MDLQVKFPEGKFNCRVAGICRKDGKVLLSKLKSDDYWTYVGGKAAFGESTGAAILREFQEELGVRPEIDRLLAVIENFFRMDGEAWHQFLFLYLLADPTDQLKPRGQEQTVLDNPNTVYQWFNASEIDSLAIKPACTKPILKSLPEQILHIVNRD